MNSQVLCTELAQPEQNILQMERVRTVREMIWAIMTQGMASSTVLHVGNYSNLLDEFAGLIPAWFGKACQMSSSTDQKTG